MEFTEDSNIKFNVSSCLDENALQQIETKFYGGDAKTACNQQVELFFKQPTHLSLSFSRNSTQFSHQKFINEAYDVAQKLGFRANSIPNRSTLIVLGLGAGYHVPLLLEKLNYVDVIVIENNKALETIAHNNINLNSLRETCIKRGGNLKVLKCQNYSSFLFQIKQYLTERHCGILADISLYRHYNNELFDEIYEKFTEWRNSLVSMWGYAEDEIIGIRHTLANNDSLRVFKKSDFSCFSDTTALIVGNGPSLDLVIQDIKSFKGLIVSCGTSLASLLKNNITPHIHVEMERTECNHTLKERYLSDPALKNTVLLTLNTVSPKTLSLFKNKLVFFKANDSASEMLKLSNNIDLLYHCNPTVTNAAAAALIYMGVEKIILSGCDYGFIDEKEHHSIHSQYYNESDRLSKSKFKGSFYVKGNNTDKVLTTRIFNESKKSLESLFKVNPKVKIYNISNGAKIDGTLPTQKFPCDVAEYNNEYLLHTISTFKTVNSTRKAINENVSSIVKVINSLNRKILSSFSYGDVVNGLSKTIRELEENTYDRAAMILLSGSLKYILFSIQNHTNHISTNSEDIYIKEIKEDLIKAIKEIKLEIINLIKDR
ncbi:motility associated factor glycosyltransferase family protein [Pseudoalteromonas peptidolytica]|uniref:motility associated factor glycosyltransferase family protein n=1 Tax=Pseudoalteromonas peptidolytica TaxID=61150 RepID=UPI00298E504E|nr:6-hydroxymethylpterin diphosphokinase MptE-like protein [Pseudoalteromonas peptidolytica]MDW7548427.1 6-hydroxymethylpterin diphosphokinase MptE-like protein [Pseudoalteromonas peptidolytica]